MIVPILQASLVRLVLPLSLVLHDPDWVLLFILYSPGVPVGAGLLFPVVLALLDGLSSVAVVLPFALHSAIMLLVVLFLF